MTAPAPRHMLFQPHTVSRPEAEQASSLVSNSLKTNELCSRPLAIFLHSSLVPAELSVAGLVV